MSNATESQPLSAAVLEGDSPRVLKAVPDCSVDAVVTDPPYAIARTCDVISQFPGRHGARFESVHCVRRGDVQPRVHGVQPMH